MISICANVLFNPSGLYPNIVLGGATQLIFNNKSEYYFDWDKLRTCMKNRMCNQWDNWRAYGPELLL